MINFRTMVYRAILPSRTMLALAAGILVLGSFGCETTPRSDEAEAQAERRADQAEAERRAAEREAMLERIREARIRDLSASEAAKRVEFEDVITDELAEREVKLYEAFYHAAYTTNVGLITEHFLLEPPADPPSAWYPEGVDLPLEQLKLHVLARLDRLQVPMRWTPADAPKSLTEPVRYPGTRNLATRLKVRILDRTEQGADGRPTVRARLTDATAHIGGTHQNVTAVWDGEQWKLSRDRALHVW